MQLFILPFAAIALVLALLWVIVPALHGLPTVPASRARIRAALHLAQLRADELVFDLGAGDGRVLVIAAHEFGARAVGIEIGPVQWLLCWLSAHWHGIANRVRIRRADFLLADLSEADVVYAYITSAQVPRLKRHLQAELRPGARVVTLAADLSGWQPAAVDRETLAFLYIMPPRDMHPPAG